MTTPTTATPAPVAALDKSQPIPPLENGNRLTREEFERRYQAMPHLKKAELIEGVVYVSSAVRWRDHGSPQAVLIGWLTVYWAGTPGVEVGDNSSIRLDLENEPQPDAAMLVDPARGGQARISADGYVEGEPELVAEIASSSVSFDVNTKLEAYRRNGVREYLVWRVGDGAIDWFVLRGTQYARLHANALGIYQSEVFPGLWLDSAALIRRDVGTVLQTLQQGLGTPEHAAFITQLQPAAPERG